MMTVTYTLQEEDYLTHQLYAASQSEKIKKKRQINKVVVSMAYVIFGALSIGNGNGALGFAFIAIGGLWFFFYPIWERKRYVKSYREHVREKYKDIAGRVATIMLGDDYIRGEDEGSEGRIAWNEVTIVIEVPTIIMLRLKSGHNIVLPKNTEQTEPLKEKLKELARKHDISYSTQNNWEWR